jgi:hypothetical protein
MLTIDGTPRDLEVIRVAGNATLWTAARVCATPAVDCSGIAARQQWRGAKGQAERAEPARLCLQDGRVSRYARVSLSTVARIRQAGFPLEPTLDAPHYSVVFPDLSAETLERFRNCFDSAQPNPPTTLPR